MFGETPIVVLVGSTRFKKAWESAILRESLKGDGRIVLSVPCYPHAENVRLTPGEKDLLEDLHRRKIDLADQVLVIDVNGYVGDATRAQIEYAKMHGKEVRYLSCEKGGDEEIAVTGRCR